MLHNYMTTGEINIGLCKRDIENMERYISKWTLKDYSAVSLKGLYNSLMTLVSMLHIPLAAELFTRASYILRLTAGRYMLSSDLILKAVESIAYALKQQIPIASRPYFIGLNGLENVKDVPMSFELPPQDEIRRVLSEEGGDDIKEMGMQLGTFITRWNKISSR
jgi:hypothetical protein